MTITDLETTTSFDLVELDLYKDIHKGIRAELFALTNSAGSVDPEDAQGRAAVVAHATFVGSVLESHAHHEDTIVDPVLEVHLPELAEQITRDHGSLECRFRSILDLAVSSLDAAADDRARLSHLLYLDLATFTSRYLAHQDLEERVVMPRLEAAVGLEVVLGLHQAIVGSIPPEEMAQSLAFMLPAMNGYDRVAMLSGMRVGAPPEAFAGVVDLARSVLDAGDFAMLAQRLGL